MKRTNNIDHMYVERELGNIADRFVVKKERPSPFAKLKSNNFMTPNIVTRRKLPNNVWFELSYGTGFDNDYIMGVTLIDGHNNSLENLQGCCHEFAEVEEVLNKAKELF